MASDHSNGSRAAILLTVLRFRLGFSPHNLLVCGVFDFVERFRMPGRSINVHKLVL